MRNILHFFWFLIFFCDWRFLFRDWRFLFRDWRFLFSNFRFVFLLRGFFLRSHLSGFFLRSLFSGNFGRNSGRNWTKNWLNNKRLNNFFFNDAYDSWERRRFGMTCTSRRGCLAATWGLRMQGSTNSVAPPLASAPFYHKVHCDTSEKRRDE